MKHEDVEVIVMIPKSKLDFFKMTLPIMEGAIASVKDCKDFPHLQGLREDLLRKKPNQAIPED